MRSARAPLWVGTTIFLILAAACSDGVSPTTSVFESASTTSTTTSSTTTTSTSTTSTTTTTTPVVTDTVGDPAALEQLVQQLNDDHEQFGDEIPLPDLTNPDASIALEELQAFELWVAVNLDSPEWPLVYTYPGSDGESKALGSARLFSSNNWRVELTQGPLEVTAITMVDVADAPVPEAIRSEIPPGTVALTFLQRLPGYRVVDLDDDSIVDDVPQRDPQQYVTLLVPTSTGWQRFYSGQVNND